MKVKDLVKNKDGKLYRVKSVINIKGLPQTLEFFNVKGEFLASEYEVFTPEYTPEKISKLNKNEIFVFGSNTEGIHGAGAAKIALDNFGAILYQAEGLQGQSYAIITTDLSTKSHGKFISEKYPLESIYEGILRFLKFAETFPQYKFYVTKIGTNLAGYSIEEIATQFKRASIAIDIPKNVILPYEFEFRYLL